MLNMGWFPGRSLGKSNVNILEPIRAIMHDGTYGLGYDYLEDEKNEDTEALLTAYIQSTVNSLKNLHSAIRETPPVMLQRDNIISSTVFRELEYNGTDSAGNLPILPEISVEVNGMCVSCLVDSGSQVTVISRDTYNELISKGNVFPVMPISKLQLRGAIGQRSSQINQITLIPIKIDDALCNTPCLIVDKLIKPIILGFNWMEDNRVILKCNKPAKLIIGALGNKEIELLDSTISRRSICEKGEDEDTIFCEHTTVGAFDITEEHIKDYVATLRLQGKVERALLGVLIKRKKVFSNFPGVTDLYKHEIRMLDETPFVKYPYPVPFAFRKRVAEKIEELEELGIITRSPTPYSSPLTYTVKRDGTVRILLDARELNTRMEGETEKPPIISEILQQFHGVKFISTLDLNNAYFQIRLHENSVKYTGFVFDNKSYVYLRLPQGLKTSVSGFTRAMDIVLGPEVRGFCTNYLDDVCCFNNGDIYEHIDYLDKILERFEIAGLTCGLSKCQFFRQRVKMLGHIISSNGIEMDEEKMLAIKNFPVPKKVKHLRAFLGLCNYYRRFINKYAEATKPLCELLKKSVKWNWGETQQEHFDNVKELFLEAVLLRYPDPNKAYYLQTDSSGYALGGCLYQLDEDRLHQVISFCSKGFSEAEKRWSVSEQEMWAIIYCLKKFETYVRGAKLIIRTDHHSLTFLRSWKLHCNRVIRWLMFLNQFDYTIEYVTGKENVAADVLSRYTTEAKIVQEDKIYAPEIATFMTEHNKPLKVYMRRIKRQQIQDEKLASIIRELLENPDAKILVRSGEGEYRLCDGVLYVACGEIRKLVIPESDIKEIIWHYHKELGHSGSYKIMKILNSKYYCPYLKSRIKDLLRICHECQLAKINNCNTTGPCKPVTSKRIGEKVMADLYGPLPKSRGNCQYVFVMQDVLSKYVKLYPIRKATSYAVLNAVKKFCETLKPECLITDQGTQFRSKTWLRGLEDLDIRPTHTSVFNPRPNCTERFHRELGNMLRIYCEDTHQKWAIILKQIENCHNSTIHCSTNYSPDFLVFGKKYKSSVEGGLCIEEGHEDLNEARKRAAENLLYNATRRSKYYDSNHRIVKYKIGQTVKLRTWPKSDSLKHECAKLFYKYKGPYVVAAIPYENVYTLMQQNTKRIIGNYNAFNIERYYV